MNPDSWKKAERLFLECSELSGDERAALLDEACRGDPELREAVEGLLRGDTGADAFGDAVGRAAGHLAGTADARWHGAKLGPYTLRSRIAAGGMGVVFLAERSDDQFEQRVAIKLLTSAVPTDELRARFLSERQILSDLNDPNIARLLDGGETDDGIPYLVMEYIDGVPIDEYCDQHALTVHDRIELFLEVCSAVQYAHGNLVVHRDIKPSNILVTADGVPKLLDFGIAKLLDPPGLPGGAAMTVDGSRLLTPRHASPEQISGGRITTASDVYSLGLLLYELLSGSFPYDLDDAGSVRDVEDTITGVTPQAPSARVMQHDDATTIGSRRQASAGELRRTLDGDLDTIALKTLRKDPARRYRSAQALADDLTRYLERRPILARRPTAGYLLSRYWMRHRTAAIGIVATLAAVLVGTAAATIGFVKARESARVAAAEARNSTAISEFLVSLFQEANPDTSAGNERSVRELLDIGRERVDSELDGSPLIRARVLETLSSVYKGLAEYDTAAELLTRAVAYHESAAPDDLAVRARLLNDVGDLHRIQSRHEEAATLIGRALELHRRIGGGPTDDHADAVNNLGLVYEESGNADEARQMLELALRMRRKLYEAPHAKIALSLHNLAWHHYHHRDHGDAIRYAREAVDMRVAVFGEVHPRVASTVSLLSGIYLGAGLWDEAEAAARRSVAIAEQIFETGHPDLTFPMYRLANVLRTRGELGAARDMFEQIVAWERVSLGPDSHDLGMSMRVLAATLLELADFERAEPLLRGALDIFVRLPGGSDYSLHGTRTLLGDLLLRTGRLDEAAAMLASGPEAIAASVRDIASWQRRLVLVRLYLAQGDAARASTLSAALVDELLAAGDPLLPQALQARAAVMAAAGRDADAIEALHQAREIYAERWGPDYWRTAVVEAELGRIHLASGRRDAARPLLGAALSRLERSLGRGHPETEQVTQLLRELQM